MLYVVFGARLRSSVAEMDRGFPCVVTAHHRLGRSVVVAVMGGVSSPYAEAVPS